MIRYAADDDIDMTAGKKVRVNSDDVMEHSALNRMSQKSKVIELTGEDSITLKVGAGTLTMTQDAIVLRFGGTAVTLTDAVLDQVAAMIHLNKDSAG